MYDRSIAAGSTVVTVTVDEAQVARVTEILNQHAPLHIGERAAEYQIPTAGAGTGALRSAGVAEADMASRLGTSAYDSETGVGPDYGRRRYSRHPGRGHAANFEAEWKLAGLAS